MLLDSPLGFVQAVLHRMADSCEPFQIRGVKSEKAWVLGRFDNERVLEIYHDFSSLIVLAEIEASNEKRREHQAIGEKTGRFGVRTEY